MAYSSLQFQLLRDNVLRINHPELPATPSTYITSASAAAATTLTVRDNAGFSNSLGGDMLLIGNFGDEQAEIKEVDGAITAGTSLTVTAATFAHPINTPVRKIIFDQIEIYGNSSASSSGSTLITTINIDVSSPYTEYIVTGTTYAFYGIRGIRSTATTYQGGYSDFIAAAGFSTDTVGFLIQQAFDACGEQIRPEGRFSRQWAYDQIFLGEQDIAKELKQWSWLQEFEYDAGNITLGMRSVALPTDIDDDNTSKSILGLRIGKDVNLTYVSKSEYEYLFQDVAYTTVATTYAAGATTIVLTDSRDFDASGSFNVYTGTSIDDISYTTNTKSTSTITGVTDNDSGGTALEPVWQGEPQGKPSRYTIYEGSVYFDTVPDNTANLIGLNIWLDYYKKVTRVNTDGDSISVPDAYCVQLWLESMIKKHKSGGMIDPNDSSYIGYLQRKKRLIDNEISGQKMSLVPMLVDEYDEVY
mgnify:CR=1 FL=1